MIPTPTAVETFSPPQPQRSISIEHWTWSHRNEVRMWLVDTFGVHGDRWYEDQDYDLTNLVMDEDVYNWYVIRWES
jgi:hypothetical protein